LQKSNLKLRNIAAHATRVSDEQGEYVMRVRSDNCGTVSEINLASTQLSLRQERTASRPEFNASFEKKIERLWFQSKHLGWSYNDFVSHLLEILVVLQRRDKIKLPHLSAKEL